MKRPSTVRIACFATLLLCLFAGCDNRSIDKSDSVPEALVSVEKFEEPYFGVVCPNVNGAFSGENCGPYSSTNVRPYLASGLKVESVLKVAQSGGGYIFRFSWTHQLSAQIKADEARVDWLIYVDEKGQAKPTTVQLEDFLGGLRNYLFPPKPEFISDKLLAGKVYTFYLVGQVSGTSLDEKYVFVQVLYARLIVDISTLKPN